VCFACRHGIHIATGTLTHWGKHHHIGLKYGVPAHYAFRVDVLERTQQLAIAMGAAPGPTLSQGGEGGPAAGEQGGGGGGLNKAALMDTLRTLQEQMQVMQSQSGAMAAMQVSRACGYDGPQHDQLGSCCLACIGLQVSSAPLDGFPS
jgi:hypothetical protein